MPSRKADLIRLFEAELDFIEGGGGRASRGATSAGETDVLAVSGVHRALAHPGA